jgi:hypothetical protein
MLQLDSPDWLKIIKATPPVLFSKHHKVETELELLAFVIDHPACWQPIKDRATPLQAGLRRNYPWRLWQQPEREPKAER